MSEKAAIINKLAALPRAEILQKKPCRCYRLLVEKVWGGGEKDHELKRKKREEVRSK